MKILTFIFLFLSVFGFGQTDMVKRGELINEKYIVTAVDSNEAYIWIGSNQGLFRINRKNNRKKYYSLSNTGFPVNYVTDLHCCPDGCVWVATNNGLLKYDNYGFISYSIENSNLPENFITSVAAGPADDLLIGTAHSGTIIMHRNRFQAQKIVDKKEDLSQAKTARAKKPTS